jgi:hypothetical protein
MTRKQFNINGKLVSLSDLGYKYIDIDDVWQGYRAPNGLAPASNFPERNQKASSASGHW